MPKEVFMLRLANKKVIKKSEFSAFIVHKKNCDHHSKNIDMEVINFFTFDIYILDLKTKLPSKIRYMIFTLLLKLIKACTNCLHIYI